MPRALVIGVTGNIGHQAVLNLAASGQPVRALTRQPETALMPPATFMNLVAAHPPKFLVGSTPVT